MHFIKPMLLKLFDPSTIPASLKRSGYIYEPKLDGIRALCFIDGDKKEFFTRNDKPITNDFPDLQELIVHARQCILDGEIIAYKNNKPSFEALQQRKENPNTYIVYVVFDILEENGHSLLKKPLSERKQLLNAVIIESKHIEIIPFFSDGIALWQNVKKNKLEGVVGKKYNAPYKPNNRDGTWIKIKMHDTADCVIIGFSHEKRAISALLLGMYDNHKKLTFIGRVGTGFGDATIKMLEEKLKPFVIKNGLDRINGSKNLDIQVNKHDRRFFDEDITLVKPKLVAEVNYAEWTDQKKLRSPVFLRLRDDKNPEDCLLP